MKGPAIPHLGVIIPVSENDVFSFLRTLNTDGHLLTHSTVSHSLVLESRFSNNFKFTKYRKRAQAARQDWTHPRPQGYPAFLNVMSRDNLPADQMNWRLWGRGWTGLRKFQINNKI